VGLKFLKQAAVLGQGKRQSYGNGIAMLAAEIEAEAREAARGMGSGRAREAAELGG